MIVRIFKYIQEGGRDIDVHLHYLILPTKENLMKLFKN